MDEDDKPILSKPLIKKQKNEVAIASVHFLFATIVQYSISHSRSGTQIEDKEIRILPMLTFVSQNCWKYLFGRSGELFKSGETETEYMLSDKKFLFTRYTQSPAGDGFINCAAFGAGIVEGILCGAEFPAKVAAHNVPDPKTGEMTTTFFIDFLPEVLLREKRLLAASGGQ